MSVVMSHHRQRVIVKLRRIGWPERKIAKELGLPLDVVREVLARGPR